MSAAIERAVQTAIKLADQLQEKSYTTSKAEWMLSDEMGLYIRAQKRFISHQMREVITIASIEVSPQFQRQGLFKRLVERLEQVVRDKGMYALVVESVQNPDLAQHLAKSGFELVTADEPAPSYYRLVLRDLNG